MKRQKVEKSRRQLGERRKRPWLRRAGVIVGCLLAGAIINVLVAWGCALSMRAYDPSGAIVYPPTLSVIEHDGLTVAEIALYQDWGKGTIETSRWPGEVGIITRVGMSVEQRRRAITALPNWARPMFDVDEPFDVERQLIGAGFPMYCLRAELHSKHRFRLGTGAIDATSIPIGRQISDAGILRIVPVDPIWPGFLVNTTFYGVITWFLLTTIVLITRAVRRHRCTKRRLCPSCGYDLRGADHGKCPECGEAVR